MANKYCNLVGTNKIKDEYSKINAGFDGVETDVNAVNGRVNTIITTPIDGQAAAQELVDARGDYATLGDRLDDYTAHLADIVTDLDGVHGLKIESGTFTPTLAGSTVAGNNTYTRQFGTYYRIGNMVHCNIGIILSNKDSEMNGNISIRNLPFVIKSASGHNPAANISDFSSIDLLEGRIQIGAGGVSGSTTILLYANGDNVSVGPIPASSISNTSSITLSISYQI